MRKNLHIDALLQVGIFVALLITVIFTLCCAQYHENIIYDNSYLPSEAQASNTSWQYREGDCTEMDAVSGVPVWALKENASEWKDYAFPGQAPIKESTHDVWLRYKLPDFGSISDPSMYFITEDQSIQVYCAGKQVYAFGYTAKPRFSRSPGTCWHIIPLQPEMNGQYIYFRQHSGYNRVIGVIVNPQIGSTASHLLRVMTSGLDYLVLAFMFLFIGMASLILFLRVSAERLFLSLSLFTLCLGVWLISITDIKQLFIHNPLFWYYTYMLSLFLSPVGICAFVQRVFDTKWSRLLRYIWNFYILFTVAAVTLDLTEVLALSAPQRIFLYSLTVPLIYIIFVIIDAIRRKNPDAITFTIGFVVLSIFAFYEIFGGYFRIIPWTRYYLHWGMFAFVCSLFFILGRRYFSIHSKLNAYSREIESMDASITESKRLLDAALEYDKLRSEFFSNISHDLRTPLNIMLSTLQLSNLHLRNIPATDSATMDMQRYIKRLRQNCYRLLRLVNNLIDITKIDSGFLKPRMINCNIISIVEDICMSVVDYIKGKNMTFTFDTDVEEKYMACDPQQIERLFLNLLSNSVKFSESKSSIKVFIHDEGDNISITVSDTGIGIPQEKLTTIFERFQQADRSLTRQYEGSGIGLSLVKSLVEMHSGTVTASSQTGVGTSIKITLPVTLLKNADGSIAPIQEQAEYDNYSERVNIEFSDVVSS